MEFEHIRHYVRGDDFRRINWKASARKNDLMINQYQDEKAQHVYSIIDMGRSMKMPFNELTLLDYAINTSLVISNISILKGDKSGLMTFNTDLDSVVLADNKKGQIRKIQESLYNASTDFLEPNFEKLVISVNNLLSQRSLLIVYTNFETLSNMKRHFNYLKILSKKHLVVVVFFVNTEISHLMDSKPETISEIYHKVIVEELSYEKHEIIKEFERWGIIPIYSRPEELTVNTINKYLEIKTRNLL